MTEAADGALAAVNGDFFTPEGLPLGPELSRGSLRSARARPVLGWRPRSTPWIGVPAVGAGSLTVPGWDTEPVDGLSSIVAGYPELLDGGLRVGDLLVDENAGFAAARHPRTAVGFDSSNDRLWVLVVDGRQPAHSVGMTLPELAGLLEGLGVDEALNLDGGGSSVMVIAGRAVSRPSDEAGERAVANALVLTRDRRFCGRRSPGP